MKKLIPIIITLGFLSLVIQFIVQIFIKNHEVNYSIITGDNSYMINEKLVVEGNEHVYSFRVVDEEYEEVYYFDFVHDYNKQDNIIRDIKLYKYDDLICLFPIYKKGYSSDIVCNYKGNQVTYSYLKQMENESAKDVVLKLKKAGYDAKTWKKDTTAEEYDIYKIYKDNLPDDVVFSMWFYHGFHRIGKDKIEEKYFLNDDHYENDSSFIVDGYLVALNTDENGTDSYMNIYIFDLINNGKIKLDFEELLSHNSYFNGVYEDKLYFTDLEKKKQYSLNPAYEVLKEVGNVEDGFKVLEGKRLVTVKAKDFLEEKVYFEKEIKNTKLEKLYGATEIKKDGTTYYFVNEDGNFYKVYLTDIKNPILLFNFESVSEWSVKDGGVMVVSKDMMYFYNDEVGLLPILQNSELNYNYKNICNFVVNK